MSLVLGMSLSPWLTRTAMARAPCSSSYSHPWTFVYSPVGVYTTRSPTRSLASAIVSRAVGVDISDFFRWWGILLSTYYHPLLSKSSGQDCVISVSKWFRYPCVGLGDKLLCLWIFPWI